MDRRNFMKTGLAGLASAAAASVAGCWGGGYFGSYMPRQESQPMVVDFNSIKWVPAGREIYVGNIKTANCFLSQDGNFARLGDNIYRYNPNTNKLDIYVGRFAAQQAQFEDGLPTLILCNDWIDNGDKVIRRGELAGFGNKQFEPGENFIAIGLNKTGRDARMRLVWYFSDKQQKAPESNVYAGGWIYSRQFFNNEQVVRGIVVPCSVELEIESVPSGREEFTLFAR